MIQIKAVARLPPKVGTSHLIQDELSIEAFGIRLRSQRGGSRRPLFAV